MKFDVKNSPNQSARIHGASAVRLVVAHTPEGSYASAIGTCMNPRAQVSYHRLYKKDGTEATQLVPWNKKAWHAGALNSLSDGLAVEGHARHFNLTDPGTRELAKGIAERLVARKLKPQWTTDPQRGGFCRHGDLQSNRTDPTPDLAEWRQFVKMVQAEYVKLFPHWPVPTGGRYYLKLRDDKGLEYVWGPAEPGAKRMGPYVRFPGSTLKAFGLVEHRIEQGWIERQ